MSGGARRPLDEMAALADEVVGLLEGVVDRIAVAGSIRRRVPDVADLEIVCVPTLVAYRGGLWGDEPQVEDRLAGRIDDLLTDGTLTRRRLSDERAPAAGSRYRSLTYRGAPLDLFSPDAESYAVVLVIRTGPASFSRRLVTPRSKGGLLPDFMRVKDGRLWSHDQLIPTFQEAEVFRAIGLSYVPPERRTGAERAAMPT